MITLSERVDGLTDCIAMLYALTGNKKYLDLYERYYQVLCENNSARKLDENKFLKTTRRYEKEFLELL